LTGLKIRGHQVFPTLVNLAGAGLRIRNECCHAPFFECTHIKLEDKIHIAD